MKKLTKDQKLIVMTVWKTKLFSDNIKEWIERNINQL